MAEFKKHRPSPTHGHGRLTPRTLLGADLCRASPGIHAVRSYASLSHTSPFAPADPDREHGSGGRCADRWAGLRYHVASNCLVCGHANPDPSVGGYTPDDCAAIVGAYQQQGDAVGMDWFLALAQMSVETGALTSWWSLRPQRNPAGIGVTGQVQAGTPDQPPGPGWTWHNTEWEEG